MTKDKEPVNILPAIRNFGGHDWFTTNIYSRNLPHWELKGSTYFISFRVDSKRGKPFLNEGAAKLMIATLHRYNQKKYILHAFVVMPDHVHIIIKPILNNSLIKIMHNLKGSSAYEINKHFNLSGKFWQSESFDHLIRDSIHLRDKWNYIRDNPVEAKLANKAEDYPFSSFFQYSI